MKFRLSIIALVVVAVVVLSFKWMNPERQVNAKPVFNNADTSNLSNKKSSQVQIDILAVGDMMLGTNYPDKSTLPPNEGKGLLMYADSVIKHANVSFGNMEGTFLDNGGTPKGSGPNIYNFRQPTAYAKLLKQSGFDLLSIANNHINDFGPVGIASTAKTLEENGLPFAGTPSHPYCIIEREGLKIGLLAFAPNAGCLNMLDTEKAVDLVKKVKGQTDILLVSFHGGAEGASALHLTRKKEVFFNQDRGNVYTFAHSMIDAGADMVIGHGPHVPRALELYRSKLIAYSLGNFCTYAKFSLRGPSGYAPMLLARVNEKGDFVSGRVISFKQEGEGGPVPDPTYAAANLISKLSKEDVPESRLAFAADGTISISTEQKEKSN